MATKVCTRRRGEREGRRERGKEGKRESGEKGGGAKRKNTDTCYVQRMRCNERANGGSSSLDGCRSHDPCLDLFRELFELLREEGGGGREDGTEGG